MCVIHRPTKGATVRKGEGLDRILLLATGERIGPHATRSQKRQ